MSSNHKLSGVLQGRTIENVAFANDVCTISLLDGAQMRIKLAPRVLADVTSQESAATQDATAPRGVVKGVRQSGTTLDFDLENGQTLSFQTLEATSCVMLRDQNGVLEYAD